MDKDEAMGMAAVTLAPLREVAYDELIRRFVDGGAEWLEEQGASGQSYRIQVQGFWDDRPGGAVRVMACVDDRSARRFIKPICSDFIKRPDGSFVGE